MPHSVLLLLGKILVNLTILIFILTLATSSMMTALWRSAIFIGIIAAYTFTLLKYRGAVERFVQVFSGLLATMAMILLPLAVPYVIIMFFLAGVSSNSVYLLGLAFSSILLLIASLWLYVVFARLYRHALNLTINQGFMVSLLLFALCMVVFWIF